MNVRESAIEYELIDIKFSEGYDLLEDEVTLVCEDGPTAQETSATIQYDTDGVPMGNRRPEIDKRREIIHDFIQQWRAGHEDKRVFNNDLQEYIRINQVFLLESVAHSVNNYKSTKAVLRMEDIMANAVCVGESKKRKKHHS